MNPVIRNEKLGIWFDRLALATLLAAFFMAPLNTLRFGGVAVGDFFVMILIVLVPVSILLFGVPGKAIPRWVLIAGAIFAASLVLTLIFPFDYDRSLYERLTEVGDPYPSSAVIWVRLVFAILVFPMVVGLLIRNWGWLKWIAGAWVAGVCLSCLVAIVDAGLGTHVQESVSYDAFAVRGYMGVWADVTEYQRFVGLTDHPNTLGITAAMACPITLCWLTSRRRLLVVGPVLFLLVAGVFLSGSRAALVGLLAAGAAMIFMYRGPVLQLLRGFFGGRKGRIRLGVAVSVIVLGLAGIAAVAVSKDKVGPVASSVTFERIFDPGSDSAKTSNDERSNSLEAGIDAVAAYPVVGTGYIWIETPHNIVLGLLMSGGILALVAFIWAMVGYVRMGLGVRRQVPEAVQVLMAGSLASLIAYFVMSPLVNQSFNRYLYLPAALLMAGWVILQRQEKTD